MRVDSSRNLLILAGPGREMQTWLSLIDTFDVDWLAGMSFGLSRWNSPTQPRSSAILKRSSAPPARNRWKACCGSSPSSA